MQFLKAFFFTLTVVLISQHICCFMFHEALNNEKRKISMYFQSFYLFVKTDLALTVK